MEARIAHLEGGFNQIGERLNSIDRRLDGIDRRFDSIDRRFDSLEQRVDLRFNWLTGVVIATWITTILAIVFHR